MPPEIVDYYAVLGVDKSATAKDIKSAYKKKALELHPDKNPGLDAVKFQEVEKAYRVLSDEEKRAAYDRGFGVQSGRGKASQLSQKDFEAFESLARKVLEIVNKFKKDIPITNEGSWVSVGTMSREDTEENLSNEERGSFTRIFSEACEFLRKEMPVSANALGVGRANVREKMNEASYPHTNLRYGHDSVSNIAKLLGVRVDADVDVDVGADRARESALSKFLLEYSDLLDFVRYWNKVESEDNGLVAKIATGEDGKLCVEMRFDYSVYIEEEQKGLIFDKVNALFKNKGKKIESQSSFPAHLMFKKEDFVAKFSDIKDDIRRAKSLYGMFGYCSLKMQSAIRSQDALVVERFLDELLDAIKGAVIGGGEFGAGDLQGLLSSMGISSEPPLLYAVKNGVGVETIKVLVKKGFDSNYRREGDDFSAVFYCAVQNCDLKVVNYLYESLGSPDLRGVMVSGMNLLHLAVRELSNFRREDFEKRLEVIDFLASKGASFDEADEDGCTPINTATRRGGEIAVRVEELRKKHAVSRQENDKYAGGGSLEIEQEAFQKIKQARFEDAITDFEYLAERSEDVKRAMFYKFYQLKCYLLVRKGESKEAKSLFAELQNSVVLTPEINQVIEEYRLFTTPLKNLGGRYNGAKISDILASVTISDADPKIRARTVRLYEEMCQVKSLRPLLQVMAYAALGFSDKGRDVKPKLRIVATAQEVPTELGGQVGGFFDGKTNTIYFNVGGASKLVPGRAAVSYSDQVLKGFLAHEMHHAWGYYKHGNLEQGYDKDEVRDVLVSSMEEVEKSEFIARDLNDKIPSLLSHAIFDVGLYPKDQKKQEIVVRTSHAIAALTGMKDGGGAIFEEEGAKALLQSQFGPAYGFFKNECGQMDTWNKEVVSKGAPAMLWGDEAKEIGSEVQAEVITQVREADLADELFSGVKGLYDDADELEFVIDFDCTMTNCHLGVPDGVGKIKSGVVEWKNGRPALNERVKLQDVCELFANYVLLEKMMQKAVAKGFKIVILTKNSPRFVESVLEKTGLLQYVNKEPETELSDIIKMSDKRGYFLESQKKGLYLDDNPEIGEKHKYKDGSGIFVPSDILPAVSARNLGSLQDGKYGEKEVGLTYRNVSAIVEEVKRVRSVVSVVGQGGQDVDVNIIPQAILDLFPGDRPSTGCDSDAINRQDLVLKKKLEKLLGSGAISPNARVFGDKGFSECYGKENLSLLYLCARHGFFETLNMLLDKEADPLVVCKENGDGRGIVAYDSFCVARGKVGCSVANEGKIANRLKNLPEDAEIAQFCEEMKKEIGGKERRVGFYLNPDCYGTYPYNCDDEDLEGSYLNIKKRIKEGNFTQELFEFVDEAREIICYGSAQYFNNAEFASVISTPDFVILEGFGLVRRFAVLRSVSTKIEESKISKSKSGDSKIKRAEIEGFFAGYQPQPRTCKVENMQDIIGRNICVGESHSHASPKRFLIENMARLKQEGYEILFMEHLQYDCVTQIALDKYFQSPRGSEIPVDLKGYLELLNSGHMVYNDDDDESRDSYDFLEIVKAAKDAGIRIVGLENEYSVSAGLTKLGAGGKERTQGFNYIASEIIKAEAGDAKWVALMGNTHVRGFEKVPGVAEMLDAVAVNIFDKNERGVDVKYGNDAVINFGPEGDGPAFDLKADVMIKANPGESLSFERLGVNGKAAEANLEERMRADSLRKQQDDLATEEAERAREAAEALARARAEEEAAAAQPQAEAKAKAQSEERARVLAQAQAEVEAAQAAQAEVAAKARAEEERVLAQAQAEVLAAAQAQAASAAAKRVEKFINLSQSPDSSSRNPLFNDAEIYRPVIQGANSGDRYDFAVKKTSQIKELLDRQKKKEFNCVIAGNINDAIVNTNNFLARKALQIGAEDAMNFITIAIKNNGFSGKTDKLRADLAVLYTDKVDLLTDAARFFSAQFQQICKGKGLLTGNQKTKGRAVGEDGEMEIVAMRTKRINPNDLPDIIAYADAKSGETSAEESRFHGVFQRNLATLKSKKEELLRPNSSPAKASANGFGRGGGRIG